MSTVHQCTLLLITKGSINHNYLYPLFLYNYIVSSEFLYLMVSSNLILCRYLYLYSNLGQFIIILEHKMASCEVNVNVQQ